MITRLISFLNFFLKHMRTSIHFKLFIGELFFFIKELPNLIKFDYTSHASH